MITPRHPQGASSGKDPDEDPTGVRALLSSLPEPGPMPPELVARITASLEREQQARGRLSGAAGDTTTVTPLIQRPAAHVGPSRLRRVLTLGGAAAAVVAVAAVGTVVALDQRQDVPAAASVSADAQHGASEGSGANGSSALPGTSTPVYFEASGKDYTSAGFAQQAKAMQASNHTPLRSGDLQKPQVQQLGPPMELSQCLQALGEQLKSSPDKVWVDLGTFDGAPAAIIVVTTDGQSRAWAVGRTCRAGAPAVLTGPTALT